MNKQEGTLEPIQLKAAVKGELVWAQCVDPVSGLVVRHYDLRKRNMILNNWFNNALNGGSTCFIAGLIGKCHAGIGTEATLPTDTTLNNEIATSTDILIGTDNTYNKWTVDGPNLVYEQGVVIDLPTVVSDTTYYEFGFSNGTGSLLQSTVAYAGLQTKVKVPTGVTAAAATKLRVKYVLTITYSPGATAQTFTSAACPISGWSSAGEYRFEAGNVLTSQFAALNPFIYPVTSTGGIKTTDVSQYTTSTPLYDVGANNYYTPMFEPAQWALASNNQQNLLFLGESEKPQYVPYTSTTNTNSPTVYFPGRITPAVPTTAASAYGVNTLFRDHWVNLTTTWQGSNKNIWWIWFKGVCLKLNAAQPKNTTHELALRFRLTYTRA